MKRLTVFGIGGLIGSKIKEYANKYDYDVKRGNWKKVDKNNHLGDVIFACGVGDINKPNEMLESHLSLLKEIVSECSFDRLTYVSSTRVYLANDKGKENSELKTIQSDERVFFNLLKLTAEKYLELSGVKYTIVRPSNVYGLALDSPLFLPSIVRDAIKNNVVNMYVDPNYAKDYVLVDDVANAILYATKKQYDGIINVCSGENVTAKKIAEYLKDLTGCKVIWHKNNCNDYYPQLCKQKLENELKIKPVTIHYALENMVSEVKQNIMKK